MNLNASSFHKDCVLMWLLHSLPMDTRQKLMRDMRTAYDDVMGVELTKLNPTGLDSLEKAIDCIYPDAELPRVV